MVAAAWRAFRGERKGMLLGPGPGFKEAINAALASGPAQPDAEALREEVGRLRAELEDMRLWCDAFSVAEIAERERRIAAERRERDALAMTLFVGLCAGERLRAAEDLHARELALISETLATSERALAGARAERDAARHAGYLAAINDMRAAATGLADASIERALAAKRDDLGLKREESAAKRDNLDPDPGPGTAGASAGGGDGE